MENFCPREKKVDIGISTAKSKMAAAKIRKKIKIDVIRK
jgi:hypothetical protein